jgi:spore coat polysaccharide biosynthesis protein SpsF
MKAGIILQARMASQRLPGKALEPIAGRSLIVRCLQRLGAAGVGPVILATTTGSEDDTLVSAAQELGAAVFRGSAEDVLGRYRRCAAQFGLERVVRATGDNPGVDINAPGRLLDALAGSNAEYVREDDLPYGGGVEALTVDALNRAAGLARDPFDREHVTTYIRRHPEIFRTLVRRVPAPLARPDVRVTVDTAGDLDAFRALHAATGRDMPTLPQLIAAWDRLGMRTAA